MSQSKKIGLKISENINGKNRRCLIKIYPDTKVSAIKTHYCILRGRDNVSDYVFLLDGKGLQDENTFSENQLSKIGMTYNLEIKPKKDVQTMTETVKAEPTEVAPSTPVAKEVAKEEVFKVKLKIQDKVKGQVVSADMEVNNSMVLEKIVAAYCKQRKYNPEDYFFAHAGKVLDVKKPLIRLGFIKPEDAGQTFIITVHDKSKVKVKE